jgi:hypothetical protein
MVELFSTLEMLGKTIEPTTLRNFVEAHVRRTIEFGLCKFFGLILSFSSLHCVF